MFLITLFLQIVSKLQNSYMVPDFLMGFFVLFHFYFIRWSSVGGCWCVLYLFCCMLKGNNLIFLKSEYHTHSYPVAPLLVLLLYLNILLYIICNVTQLSNCWISLIISIIFYIILVTNWVCSIYSESRACEEHGETMCGKTFMLSNNNLQNIGNTTSTPCPSPQFASPTCSVGTLSISNSSSGSADCMIDPGANSTAPCRYFVMKCNNQRNLDISQTKGIWATSSANEYKMNRAYKVILFNHSFCSHHNFIF